MKGLEALKGVAVELKERGYTLNILEGEKLILKMGAGAKPGLLSAFGPIEVKDLKAILKLLE
ncbi:hypothetical protein KKA03_03445 [archaeon]|nr:hypothetical protein [archaeon]